MGKELKSAWELALEKLNEQGDTAVRKLTPEQKESIAEIRKKYQAKIADAEITAQTRIKKALESGAPDEVEKVRQQTLREKQRLNREMEEKVEEIRQSETG